MSMILSEKSVTFRDQALHLAGTLATMERPGHCYGRRPVACEIELSPP